MRTMFVLLVSALLASVATATDEQNWRCVPISAKPLTPSSSVIWVKENCTNSVDPSHAPDLVVNSLSIDILAGDVKVIPGTSTLDSADPLKSVPEMAQFLSPDNKFIAGINGGYFWRVDMDGVWVDDVCRGKTRKEAETPVDPAYPSYGINDGLVKVEGKTFGYNCDNKGYSFPAVLQENDYDHSSWNIQVLPRAGDVPASVSSAIGAGPNLVSYNTTTGETYVDIPADEDNINVHEHAANTAVGIFFASGSTKATKMVMVTTDGSDECGRFDTSCGLNSHDLASLLRDHFKVQQAMSMDQGGSTTMFVQGEGVDNVVSYAGGGARQVANALFVSLV